MNSFLYQTRKSMIKRLLLLIGLGLTTTIIFGQTSLAGKVTEEGTSEGASGATIRIYKDGVLITGTQADFDGTYNISNIDPGTYTVDITYVGFNSQRVEGVVIKAGKVNTLNAQLAKGVTLDEFVVTSYKVPLVEQDNTTQGQTITSEQIRNLPNKGVNAIAATTAGVSSGGENGAITIRGSRSASTVYYLDGIPVSGNFIPTWDIEQLQVITGGLGAEYGDVTGGVISGTTKGPSNQFGMGLEVETSELFDNYGYNLVNANFSGPILKKKETNESIIGYRLSGSYTGYKDNDPSAVGIYVASDEAKAKIAADPVSELGNILVPTAEFLRNNTGEVTLSKVRPDETSKTYDATGRLDFRITKEVDVAISGTYNNTYSRFSPGNTWWLLNSQNNPENLTDLYRVNFRLRHRLGRSFSEDNTEEKAALSSFRNASYTIQLFYQHGNGKTYDYRHKDRLFDYGHVGKFFYDYTATINPILDEFGNFIGAEHVDNLENFNGVDFTNSKNPGLVQYNKLIVDPVSDDDYLQRNGFANDSYTSVWGFHTNINSIYNTYNKNESERRSFNGNMSFDFLPGGSSGRHSIQFGVFYEERISRSYTVNPYGLWQLARLLQNVHILGVDTNATTGVLLPYTVPGTSEIIYIDSLKNQIDPNKEGRFYKEIRKALGVPIDAFVNIDELDPSFLNLNMFSSRELTDNNYAGYYGYDYLGNKVSDQTQFNDFWTHRDANNERDYPVAPQHPIYGAAYIQDKFTYKDVIFRLGLRADYYDANTKVLKDKYSYKEIYTAKEFYDNNPQLIRPGAVEDDFKVYLNAPNSTSVKAFRDDEQWYFNNGNKANDGNIIFGGQVVNPAFKNNININDEKFDPNSSFRDYKGQLNLMPRLAFSFPISDEANFFAHYDILVQRPTSNTLVSPLQYYYYESSGRTPTNNPDLKPERTIDYEVGFQQKISNSAAIKISAYYKEMRDMIQSRTLLFIPVVGSLETYDNIDFGTVKGFSFSYDMRRTGNVQLTANYTLQFADGTGSDPNTQRGLSNNGNIRTLFPLNFDERHVFNLNLDYRFESGKKYNGPRPSGIAILSNTGINIDARAISGRPYTRNLLPTPRGGSGIQGALNGARLPWKFFLNLKIDKDISLNSSENSKRKYYLNVYFRAQNILNLKTVTSVYSATGDPDDAGYLLSSQGIASQNNIAQSGKDVNAYRESYQWYVLNPDNYEAPRRLYIGATFQF